jgi:hypothetical protein
MSGRGRRFFYGETIDACAAPPGLILFFRLPTLYGFAAARLQGGLNNSAPAALGLGAGQRPQPGAAVLHEYRE